MTTLEADNSYPSTQTSRVGTHVAVPGGAKVFLHDSGGDGAPLLLLHGVGCCADDWIGVAEHFHKRFRVIRPDARGHGGTSAPLSNWQLADFIADLVGVLDKLEIESAHVAGFSMGGLLAQGLAITHPERVRKLAILAATTGRTEDEQAQIEQRLAFIRENHPATYFDTLATPRWFTGEFVESHPHIIDYARRVIANNDHAGYRQAYEMLVRNDLGSELHKIRHKTLVLTGENDIGAGPRVARLIAAEIPDSHLIVLPRLKHQLLLEAPEIVGGILREFFSTED